MAAKKDTPPLTSKASASPAPHYKLSMRPVTKYRPLTLSSSPSTSTHRSRSQLFEGLENSGGVAPGAGAAETFVPRKSVKKLTIKPRPSAVSATFVCPSMCYIVLSSYMYTHVPINTYVTSAVFVCLIICYIVMSSYMYTCIHMYLYIPDPCERD